MIKNYFKVAWRNILKRKAFSFINIGGLALGMASCLLLLLYVVYHLNYDKQFDKMDNLYMVENNQPGDGKVYTFAATPGLMALQIKADIPGVEAAIRTVNYGASGLLTYRDNSFKKSGLFADPAFFSIFNYHFIKGNPATALVQPNSIVMTKEMAGILFGDADPIGKIIKRNDKTELMVSGVIDNVPPNATFQFDYVLPWQIFENENSFVKTAGWGSNFCQTLVLLKGPQYFARADAILRKMINTHQDGYKAEAMLFPFLKLHLHSKFENGKSVGGFIDQIHLFIILAICILLIACVNFMNLSTARSEERAKEVGIRKAIGSDQKMLVMQFIIESVLLSFFSLILAIIILAASLPFFNNLLNVRLAIPFQQLNVILMLFALALVTGLISGSYPAFYLSSFKPISVLKGVFKGGRGALSIRQVMVVVQFTFAVFLITATICIYRQIKYVQDKPIGFDRNNLVEVKAEGNLGQKTDLVINELKQNNVIADATSLSASITGGGNNTWGVTWPGKRADQKVLISVLHFGYDFSKTTGVKIVQGREFSSQFPSDTAGKTVMINEAAAAVMNLKHPVGTIINWGMPLTIVGVYKDFVWGSPYEKTAPMISMCSISGGSVIAMRLNPNKSIKTNIDGISAKLKNINPAYPPVISFVDSDFGKKFENEKLLATLANLFGGLAIIISCLGLLGLAAYAAEQRVKEIGVRKVLGASIGSLAALLSRDFIKLVGIAIVIAVPVSVWALNKWLQNYEYHINLSWWVIALASVITIVIALLTVCYQAIKAALANPVKSLRSE
jgi:ABC-type antimicrobial peptide transport system permease subunit